jgi:hypothetical protein
MLSRGSAAWDVSGGVVVGRDGTLAGRMAELARGFHEYLVAQTDVALTQVDGGGVDDDAALAAAFQRLDLALGQMADLASVYGDDSRAVLDPLVVPVAALAGEYLCFGARAVWVEPDPELPSDDSLPMLLANGVAVDLHGLARAALNRASPSLSAVMRALLAP